MLSSTVVSVANFHESDDNSTTVEQKVILPASEVDAAKVIKSSLASDDDKMASHAKLQEKKTKAQNSKVETVSKPPEESVQQKAPSKLEHKVQDKNDRPVKRTSGAMLNLSLPDILKSKLCSSPCAICSKQIRYSVQFNYLNTSKDDKNVTKQLECKSNIIAEKRSRTKGSLENPTTDEEDSEDDEVQLRAVSGSKSRPGKYQTNAVGAMSRSAVRGSSRQNSGEQSDSDSDDNDVKLRAVSASLPSTVRGSSVVIPDNDSDDNEVQFRAVSASQTESRRGKPSAVRGSSRQKSVVKPDNDSDNNDVQLRLRSGSRSRRGKYQTNAARGSSRHNSVVIPDNDSEDDEVQLRAVSGSQSRCGKYQPNAVGAMSRSAVRGSSTQNSGEQSGDDTDDTIEMDRFYRSGVNSDDEYEDGNDPFSDDAASLPDSLKSSRNSNSDSDVSIPSIRNLRTRNVPKMILHIKGKKSSLHVHANRNVKSKVTEDVEPKGKGSKSGQKKSEKSKQRKEKSIMDEVSLVDDKSPVREKRRKKDRVNTQVPVNSQLPINIEEPVRKQKKPVSVNAESKPKRAKRLGVRGTAIRFSPRLRKLLNENSPRKGSGVKKNVSDKSKKKSDPVIKKEVTSDQEDDNPIIIPDDSPPSTRTRQKSKPEDMKNGQKSKGVYGTDPKGKQVKIKQEVTSDAENVTSSSRKRKHRSKTGASDTTDEEYGNDIPEESSNKKTSFDNDDSGSEIETIDLVSTDEEKRPKPIPKGAHTCPLCDKVFRDKDSLLKHLPNAHSKPKFICTDCGQEYAKKDSLKHHINVEHKGQRLKCKKCDQTFKRRDQLKYHMYSHDDKFRFFCNHCGRGFNHKAQYEGHVNKHENKRPYKCGLCDTAFPYMQELQRHLKICGVDPFIPCEFETCKQKFTCQQYLRKHLKEFHKKGQPYICPQCGKVFNYYQSFRTHLQTHIR